MNAKFKKAWKKYEGKEKDIDMLMSIVAESTANPLSREKGSMLYALEAEEIDLKNLEDSG